jgi:GntR family transcriptional repressor for pyruvate dehydrogenase complex
MKVLKTRLADQVAESIQEMIARGDYNPGDKLPVENELAEMFSVSRITIREAISKLNLIGIVDVRQGDGTFVKALTPESFMKPLIPYLIMNKKNLHDVYEVRLLIETKTAELAALNAEPEDLNEIKALLDKLILHAAQKKLDLYNETDTQFHCAIAKHSKNLILFTILNLIYDVMKDAIKVGTSAPNALTKSVKYHQLIYDAIAKKDGVRAAQYMTEHIEGGAKYINSEL